MNKLQKVIIFFLIATHLFTVLFYFKSTNYLTFSDSAKYADIAKNIVEEKGYFRNFIFFSGLKDNFNNTWVADWPPPITPYSISVFLSAFGASDMSVRLSSMFYYFGSLVVLYLLTKKLYSSLVAFLAVLTIGFNVSLLNYATSGGTEIIFIFEILLGFYLLTFKKNFADLIVIALIVVMYLTRPQYFIFSFGFLLYFLLNRFSIKKSLTILLVGTILWTALDVIVLSKINGLGFYYSVFGFGNYGLSSGNASDLLRGVDSSFDIVQILKKLIYNLYNFYKALPEIMNPYLFGLFIIGIFVWGKEKLQSSFKISVLFVTLLTLLVTALTIPFYRYIHPIVPLVYILAVATLVNIFKDNKYKVYITTLLVLFFAVGQTLGVIFLDSRFEKKMKNVDKAPIYVEMSYKLKEVTNKDMVIVTNLDTWGSWYGERKTIWFPLEPSMILPVQDNIDAIYLTSYKMDDENYYMGESWREIFESPEKQTILPDFKFVGEYEFKSENNYERENGRAVLLKRAK